MNMMSGGEIMRLHHGLVSGYLAVALAFSLASVQAHGTLDVPRDSAAPRRQQTPESSPEPEAPVTLTPRPAGNRLQFRPGETIPLELTFESSVRDRYLVDGATYDRSRRLKIDEFVLTPIEPVTDPLLGLFASYLGYIGGGIRATGMLGDKPFGVTIDLNEWFRFATPRLIQDFRAIGPRDRRNQTDSLVSTRRANRLQRGDHPDRSPAMPPGRTKRSPAPSGP